MSAPPFNVKAVYEYSSPHEDDLHFPSGQIITVTEDDEEDWYTGEYVDSSGVKQEGIFPRNFVEKYEPTAPPRPTRTARPKKEDTSHAEASEPVASRPATAKSVEDAEIEVAPEPSNVSTSKPEPHAQAPPAPPAPSSPQPADTQRAAPAQPKPIPAPAPAKPTSPPPESDKPSGGSFRDRIAAFNKAAAAPVTPFKPTGLGTGGSSFIKKPFVAPPPSKDAYIPAPREPVPQRIYRREEDPEIAARAKEDQELAEKAGLAGNRDEGDEEELPKPTSLKERIALLQKQQMEQAARHAEAAQKKEKPKRPVKKRTGSHDVASEHAEAESTTLESQESQDTVGRRSTDSAREVSRAPLSRQKSGRAPPAIPGAPLRRSFGDGDGNDADMSGAGDTTEHDETSTGHDDSDERSHPAPAALSRAPTAPVHEPDVGDEEDAEEEPEAEAIEDDDGDEEEEEEIDPEIRRKEELRARMAKMSGGMGMHGMFGPPGGIPLPGMPGPGLPPKRKESGGPSERKQTTDNTSSTLSSPISRAPPVPLPGMSHVQSPEESARQVEVEEEEEEEVEEKPEVASITEGHPTDEFLDIEEIKPTVSKRTSMGPAVPPVPSGRPAPPPVPTESRPHLAPSAIPISPSAGSESDDEMSARDGPRLSLNMPTAELPSRPAQLRSQGAPAVPSRPNEDPTSPRSPSFKSNPYFGASETSPTSPSTPGAANKRASRVPPIPGASPIIPPPTQARAPPPPPLSGLPLSRSSTGDGHVLSGPPHVEQDESEEEVTEYEGDYDTDLAPTEPHKDALKSHARIPSLEEETLTSSPVLSPISAPPPLPSVAAPRAIPPPLPSQPPPAKRQSMDIPRAAPPPPPHVREQPRYDEEYDPYNYASPVSPTARSVVTPTLERQDEEDIYSSSPPRAQPPNPYTRAAPPPPPPHEVPVNLGQGPAPRQSPDTQRTATRRSADLNRMSMSLDTGFMATDIDLAEGSRWWLQPNGVPPAYQGRIDILHETEESTSTKRGGKTIITKDLYVLFQDYSQTVVTVRFDSHNPTDVSFEQRHEQPPPRPRQDQLEQSHERFGRRISEAVASRKDTIVGDGTPPGLVQELLKPFTEALLPVGTRAYGAVVYSNLANASTQQYDEIRPGDIVTLRNAKLQGKHGAMHAKYSMEVGAGPGHVGIVAEWDGTKKKVRVWEQGRESKKVKLESFKLDDLRSGEVKIWRVMPRSWVGWEGVN